MRSDEKKAILLIVKTAAQLKTDDINELSAVLGLSLIHILQLQRKRKILQRQMPSEMNF